VTELFSDADDTLFERIDTNSQHVLQRYLPDRPDPRPLQFEGTFTQVTDN